MISNLYEGVVDVCIAPDDRILMLTLSGTIYQVNFKIPLANSPSMTKVFALD